MTDKNVTGLSGLSVKPSLTPLLLWWEPNLQDKQDKESHIEWYQLIRKVKYWLHVHPDLFLKWTRKFAKSLSVKRMEWMAEFDQIYGTHNTTNIWCQFCQFLIAHTYTHRTVKLTLLKTVKTPNLWNVCITKMHKFIRICVNKFNHLGLPNRITETNSRNVVSGCGIHTDSGMNAKNHNAKGKQQNVQWFFRLVDNFFWI